MTESKPRKNPRHYTDAFKQQLVDLYRSGKRRCDICREYDISSSLCKMPIDIHSPVNFADRTGEFQI